MDTRPDSSPLPRPDEHIVAVVGAFGSGKSEVTVNLALALTAAGRRVTLVDLDLVNPYFRSREARMLLESAGVRVIVPPGDQAWADLPIVVPEVFGALNPGAGETTLLDVGGDDVGARVLGGMRTALAAAKAGLWQVVNERRPFTSTLEGCVRMQISLERSARVPVTGIVSNAHLIDETTADVVLGGLALARTFGAERGIPVRCVAVRGELAHAAAIRDCGVPVLRLERRMLPPWAHGAIPVDERSLAKNEQPLPADERPAPAARTVPLGLRHGGFRNLN